MRNNIVYKQVLVLFICVVATVRAFAQEAGSPAGTLTPAQMASFRAQAVKSIFDLEKYIQIIADKGSPMSKKNNAIDLALNLFQSDSTTVEVSSLNRQQTRTDLIPKYLAVLKILPYNSVKITWYKVYLGSKFTLGADGNYYGTATYYQKFEGINNSEVNKNYEDVTERKIKIILKKVEVYKGVDKINEYVLKLGDISVVETTHG